MTDSPAAAAKHADFVHLRVHTAYSLSEGAIRVKELVGLCQAQGMPAVAMTDTNNLFGALEFSQACAGAGVQPIIGCQVSVDLAGLMPSGQGASRGNGNGHGNGHGGAPGRAPVVLLVQSDAGYRNLLKLLKTAYLDAEDAHEPKVSLEAMEERSDGLLLLTGGPGGPVGQLLLHGAGDAARAVLQRLAAAFDGRTYVEVQRHGTREEAATEGPFLDWAYDLDLPLVATNEAFFPTRDMHEAHDALICIAQSAYLSQTERRRVTEEHYFKSAEEMKMRFRDLPEAIDNTLVVAQRCAFMVQSIAPLLPRMEDDLEGRTEEDALRELSRAGLERRLADLVFTDDMDAAAREAAARPYRERLDYELDVIVQMGFPGYFLIVSDFIQWAKARDIPVGPGRGSGAGSVVAWSLTITDLDPLRWGLLFERFLNPERVSMPDFDIDFCQDRRDEVIRYVQDKYGRDRVAQIITFGKLQARAVLRDVGRVLEMPYGYVDKICKLVPNNPANPVSLPQAIEMEPQLQEMIVQDADVARLVGIAKKLEGLFRHASTHAAGVVIGDRPLDELIPLYRDPRSDMPVTGFNMKYVESAGLVKFDFLGLKTLTVLQKAVDLIHARGDEMDLARIPLDDARSFEMMSRGETQGVFQLESAGMRDVLTHMRPDTFEDIIAVVALYRPGPMDNIPSYIRRKHGEEEADYLYPTLEGILKETFGIMIYQEQVMQIAQELSGYTLGGADLLRRAMGKKIKAEMDQQRQIFVDGATSKGVPQAKASAIFDQVNKFAGYGFNKSHAAAYALVAYQTAYLKANYPLEFLAASMTLDMGNTDKLNQFRQELNRLGIRLLGPDINASQVDFGVEALADGERAIRYALAAIKNVGGGAMAELVRERGERGPFKDLADIAERLDGRVLNKRMVENLVRAGAFDAMNANRRQMFEAVETLLRHVQAAAAERDSNQIGLFGGDAAPARRIDLPAVPDWPPMDRLKEEFDAIGFYLSAHPLDAYAKSLARLKTRSIAQVLEVGDSGAVNMAGTVISKKVRISAKGNRFAFVQFSDASGMFEATAFSEILGLAGAMLEVGNSLFIKATVQFDGDAPRITIQELKPLDQVAASSAAGLQVTVTSVEPAKALGEALRTVGKRGKGTILIRARLDDPREDVDIRLSETYAVSPEILAAARAIPGVVEVFEI
ncbi:MAG: DNA polymerase III subunit alpha [Hyphomicrobiales bacterium]|nr:DNA polymerase III subunit alpha [Hyphomicrobiales bacterium]